MIPLLLDNHEATIQAVIQQRKDEAQFATQGKSAEEFFEKHAKLGQGIGQKLGYVPQGSSLIDDEELKSEDLLRETKINMDEEAKKISQQQNFSGKNAERIVRDTSRKFDRFQGSFIKYANDLLAGEKFDSLMRMPGIADLSD